MMKKILFICCLCLMSCSEDDNEVVTITPQLLGSWRLIEQYADPGDGSGSYEPVSSDKRIEFFADGTFRANGNMCYLETGTGVSSEGTYVTKEALIEFSNENYLIPNDCDNGVYKVFITTDSTYLFLSFPCIEGCGQKFTKL